MAEPTYLTLEQLGTYIKKLREKQGLSQKDVADRLGMGKTQVGEAERIGSDFSTETARKILVELGGTTIDRERIKLPIVEASDEEKAEVKSKNRNRRENDRLPPIKTDDLDIKPGG